MTKQQIDLAFANTTTEKNIKKIYFLVWLINRDTNYQINIQNHAYLLGYKTGELTSILSKLQTAFVVRNHRDAIIGFKSNSYSVIKPFNVDTVNHHQEFFYPNECTMPIWVLKFIANGRTVPPKSICKWVKPESPKIALTKPKRPKKEETKIINQQANEIINLKAEIKRLQALTSQSESFAQSTDASQNSSTELSDDWSRNDFQFGDIEIPDYDVLQLEEFEFHQLVAREIAEEKAQKERARQVELQPVPILVEQPGLTPISQHGRVNDEMQTMIDSVDGHVVGWLDDFALVLEFNTQATKMISKVGYQAEQLYQAINEYDENLGQFKIKNSSCNEYFIGFQIAS